MIDKESQRNKLIQLAGKHSSSQIDTYKNSIFLPYISLTNVKGKGAMMEEFFEWYLNELGIDTILLKSNENYDFLVRNKIKVELKVASIGMNNKVAFNQIHFGKDKDIDKFLFVIIKPDDSIDMFVVDKEEFTSGKIKVKKQHGDNKVTCARIFGSYTHIIEELKGYKVDVDTIGSHLL